MTAPRKPLNDNMAGEIMLNEVFKIVERLNATAGSILVTKGTRIGNMSFSPKIIVDDDGHKQYTCFVEIYTQQSTDTGQQINLECSGVDVEQFKQTLTTVFIALSGLAKEGYVSDTYTVGLIKPNGEEIEVYAPQVLKPGMYSLKET
jgi:hypothetical protein